MEVAHLARVIRTARHLRWCQIAARAERVVRRRLPIARKGATTHVDLPILQSADANRFPDVPVFHHTGLQGGALMESLERGEFHHLNQTVKAGRESPDWRLGAVSQERLWTITLHYHHWVYELARGAARGDRNSDSHIPADRAESLLAEYLADWLRRCDLSVAGSEDLAWNPYAIATRLGWWVRSLRLLGEEWARRHPELRCLWRQSMWRQAAYLGANLEWDLQANHLLRDAVGLAWAGRYFSGREPDRWMRTATRLAVAQADEQMLADGGHFERSPFYHLEVMDDWLSLALLLRDEAAREKMRKTWERAAEYACWLRHPDGRGAQFNDGAAAPVDGHLRHGAAIGVYPNLAARRGGRHFQDSGVVVWHGHPWSVFFDVGMIGPDYQPAHAHADTLTIECSFAGKRLFVDPGCHSYDRNERRRYDRMTDSHNTVCIDDVDSSEVWHVFRVGRRARPCDVSVQFSADRARCQAGHHGYDHLRGQPRHIRALDVSDDGAVIVTDQVSGEGCHRVRGGFTLAPQWEARPIACGWELSGNGECIELRVSSSSTPALSVERVPYHPEYGLELETNRVVWRYEGKLPLQVCFAVTGR